MHEDETQEPTGREAPSKDPLREAAGLAVLIGAINFVAFAMLSTLIGGDATNGKVVGTAYYVSNHGTLTQVHPVIFAVSYVHGLSLFLTHPFAILGALVLGIKGRPQRTDSRR